MAGSINHQISCLCGTISQEVSDFANTATLLACHCNICRHASGVLWTSYIPIARPSLSDKLRSWRSGDTIRYFCSTCGCHVFIHREISESESASWEVATGVISGTNGDVEDASSWIHAGINDTRDGGASVWIEGHNVGVGFDKHNNLESTHILSLASSQAPKDALPASCACGNVRFHVTRPNAGSYKPHSGYPDLMYADKKYLQYFKANHSDDKWWIQGEGKKYMAGTCACRSCRLFTGFEIQQWAFIPKANIYFHMKDNEVVPLDFEKLPQGILTTYNSKSGVFREFCGGCGATVFWHDTSRPGIIDVSVGLLMAEEGARAENWLSWWTDRVSYEEDAEVGREGYPARMVRGLVTTLEKGLKEPNLSSAMKVQHSQ